MKHRESESCLALEHESGEMESTSLHSDDDTTTALSKHKLVRFRNELLIDDSQMKAVRIAVVGDSHHYVYISLSLFIHFTQTQLLSYLGSSVVPNNTIRLHTNRQ